MIHLRLCVFSENKLGVNAPPNEASKDLTTEDKKNLLAKFKSKYEVPYYLSQYLNWLEMCSTEIVFIVDDSGSMGRPSNDTSIIKFGFRLG